MAEPDREPRSTAGGRALATGARWLATVIVAGCVGGALVLGAAWMWWRGDVKVEWLTDVPATMTASAVRLRVLETRVAVLPGEARTATARPALPTMTLRIAARGTPLGSREEPRETPTATATSTATVTPAPSATRTRAASITPAPTRTARPVETSRPTATLRIVR